MSTKHEKILQYIESLPVGDKISVRQIAKEMQVSEGTAYRAIKEAENRRLVSSIERVGTIRIEKKKKENIERLTFAEIVNIIDGQVLGGKSGLHKTLTKFVIGAMQLEDMMRYTDAGSLLIVGNRIKAHENALRAGAAVLITGGFDTTEDNKQLADSLDLPIISTSYDTFTVATMINRAIYDQLIKKDILFIEDIYVPMTDTAVLKNDETIHHFQKLNERTTHGAFPVVTANNKLVGMITVKDVIGREETELIEKVMTKNPIAGSMKMSVASAGHRMIWEGIDLLPIVDDDTILQGVISRQDVLKALQLAQRQPQHGETIDDLVKNEMKVLGDEELIVEFKVTPQMTNQYGAISYGAFTTLLAEVGSFSLKRRKRGDAVAENMTIYFIKPVQMESTLTVKPRILDMSRKFVKMDFEVFNQQMLVGKAMMMFQLLER
ncbi:DRTGG domain-containing protein [Lysinibacillus pakistanensis]|uniref:CBS domain-containing protein n=1 Tax=Lysinibacillus pakistanensis TaxID=759811 RepID=A0AAX3WS09_9BACI|nr:DRTGG domain-containing protein [Lysinibacillus pakistanensis]MDM5229882.1 DRTGG domain-containing protein [Lysinibacillus pakistanensis]QGG52710.1 CBS domain-containing protein [Lysinibacillus pakistanensis]WHY45482.1 DRTGG domain-containing protein [Lysinibacillus pakistanensis]WHY50490.1 DRTGG domain-containing protein [Lysinibacillus pakistanensis]